MLGIPGTLYAPDVELQLEDFVGSSHGMALAIQRLTVGGDGSHAVVGLIVGKLSDLPLKIGDIDIRLAMPYGREIETVRVGSPKVVLHPSLFFGI